MLLIFKLTEFLTEKEYLHMPEFHSRFEKLTVVFPLMNTTVPFNLM